MRLEIDQDEFSAADYAAFARRLQDCLRALRVLLKRDGFGKGESSLGAELEVYLVDSEGHPACVNQQVLARSDDPRLVEELNQFNLEMNLTPTPGRGRPFSALGAEIREVLDRAERLTNKIGVQLLPVGVLPTLRPEHLGAAAMTPMPRYRALAKSLRRERGRSFELNIAGAEPLTFRTDDITPEGANTSLRIHLRVTPEEFANTFNASLLVTPLVLAMAGNSPYFFERQLWEETRIALLKQSIDVRELTPFDWNEPARVSFGQGWVRNGPYELFAEAVSIYPTLLAPLSNEDPVEIAEQGGSPGLLELKLHMDTTWPWVRPVYDHEPEGHFRIEMRALPSGPTVEDMMANAALMVGLSLGIRDRIPVVLPAIPFKYAEHNFYRAAKRGLESRLIWPTPGQSGLSEGSVQEIYARMRPYAVQGLDCLGLEPEERDHWLSVIDQRLERGMTGARWQREAVAALETNLPRREALKAMLSLYHRNSRKGDPVANWPLP